MTVRALIIEAQADKAHVVARVVRGGDPRELGLTLAARYKEGDFMGVARGLEEKVAIPSGNGRNWRWEGASPAKSMTFDDLRSPEVIEKLMDVHYVDYIYVVVVDRWDAPVQWHCASAWSEYQLFPLAEAYIDDAVMWHADNSRVGSAVRIAAQRLTKAAGDMGEYVQMLAEWQPPTPYRVQRALDEVMDYPGHRKLVGSLEAALCAWQDAQPGEAALSDALMSAVCSGVAQTEAGAEREWAQAVADSALTREARTTAMMQLATHAHLAGDTDVLEALEVYVVAALSR